MFGPKLEGLDTKLEMEHNKGIHVFLVSIKQVVVRSRTQTMEFIKQV
jgi:hypothetical protein